MLKTALEHAKRVPVFPLYPMRENDGKLVCSCEKGAECSAAGKHPRILKWQTEATTKPEKIRSWWGRWPDAGVGMPTGKRSGIDVVDLDGSVGRDTLTSLQVLHGALPHTQRVRTPRGTHYYFAHTGGLQTGANLLPGVDVRADGGYVVLPGSRHRSGGVYDWEAECLPEEAAPAEPPDWLVEELSGGSRPLARAQPLPDIITEGSRNTELTRLAGSMRNYGASPEAIAAALLVPNEYACVPPLPDAEVRGIAKSIGRYPPAPRVNLTIGGGNGAAPAGEEEEPGAFEPIFFEDLQERHTEWLLPGLLAEGGVTIIAGEPGAGKTTFAAELAWVVGTGEEHWLGRPKEGMVLWLGYDDPAERIRSEKLEMLGDLPEQRFATVSNPLPLSETTLALFVKLVQDLGARLVVVDTLLDLLSLSDYDKSGPMQHGMKLVRELASQTGACILATAHTSKDVTRQGVARVANSTLLTAKADCVALLKADQAVSDVCTLQIAKDRLGVGNWTQRLRRSEGRTEPVEPVSRPLTTSERVRMALEESGGELTRKDLLQIVSCVSERAVDNAIQQLRNKHIIEVTHGERFRATYILRIPSPSKVAKVAKQARNTENELQTWGYADANLDPFSDDDDDY